jgi:ribonuclease HI
MNVTINTDASFSNKHKVGTYAFWIVSNLGRITMAGPLNKQCTDSTDAEMKSILNALTAVSWNQELMAKAKTIYVNTDSMNAIHLFNDDKEAVKKFRLKSHNHLVVKFKLLKTLFTGKTIFFSHVKAHHDTDSKRSWVNDWLDTAAKEEMGRLLLIKEKELSNEKTNQLF